MSENVYRQDLERFMKEIDFVDDAVNSLLGVFDMIWAKKECRALLLNHVVTYRDEGRLEFGMVINDAVVSANALSLRPFGCELVFYLACAMYSYPIYEKKGLSRKIWLDTMEDFRFKLNECKKMHGEWGTFVFWFGRFFTADCIAFHRFEFEIGAAPVAYNLDGIDIKEGQRVINVHIPSNEKIPLTKEECDKSYALAADYFKDQLEGAPVVFMCDSWLLYDGMKSFLPADSNILRFASEYTIVKEEESYEDLWRIFYRDGSEEKPHELPEDTAMMRGYKKLLTEGIKPKTAIGYRRHE